MKKDEEKPNTYYKRFKHFLKNYIVDWIEIEKEKEREKKRKRKELSLRTRLYRFCCNFIPIVLGITLFFSVLYLLYLAGIFKTTCPKFQGRECNNKGRCTFGICDCANVSLLYTGEACSDNLIAGYNPVTNTECSGNGIGFPFISPPDFCRQDIDSGGNLVGPGWSGSECKEFVNNVRTQLQFKNNDPFQVFPSQIGKIPLCLCRPPWGGFDCSTKVLPTDEGGIVCGGHGNTSVGVLVNSTNPNNQGAQCTTIVNFDTTPIANYLTSQDLLSIQQNFYISLGLTVYCSQPQILINDTFFINIGSEIPPYSTYQVIPNTGLYQCYCTDSYQGTVCTEGRCPRNSAGDICNGNGSPFFGLGRLTNTTASHSRGKACTVHCLSGYENCNNQQCVEVQDPATPLFTESLICSSKQQAIQPAIVRCPDGSLTTPPANLKGCSIGYLTGSIDPTQLSQIIQLCTFPNINTLQYCFGVNSTGVLQFTTNGFLWNSSLPLQFSFSSPLLYFQLVTNATSTQVTSWDGQINRVVGSGLVAGSFAYNQSGEWILDFSGRLSIFPAVVAGQPSTYTICPIGTNYSGSILVPSNYSRLRASETQGGLVYIFDITSTYLLTRAFTNATDQKVLIAVEGVNQTEFYFPALDGSLKVVSQQICFSSPSDCSWLYWNGYIRNLQSTLFLCVSGGGAVTFTQTPDCIYPSSSTLLLGWDTCATGSTASQISLSSLVEFDKLERNWTERIDWSGTIQFGTPVDGDIVEVTTPGLVVLDDITIPCACLPSQNIYGNWSTLNQLWWGEEGLRPVDQLSIGDYVLAQIIDNEGEVTYPRSKIIAKWPANNTFELWNPQFALNFSAFFNQTRKIVTSEVLLGTPDGDLVKYPYRCPDGQISSAETTTRLIPTLCNCTYSRPLADCQCADLTLASWNCTCSTLIDVCECTPPALADFELELASRLDDLVNTSCQCIIFNYTQPEASQLITPPTPAPSVAFNISLNEVPQFMVVKTTGSLCSESIFNLTALSYLFENRTIPFSYVNAPASLCEFWLTLSYPATAAITSINLTSSLPIEWASILFALPGFSITGLANTAVSYKASSNESQSSLIGTLNSSYWLSGFEFESFIEIDLNNSFVVNYTSIVFYQSGVQLIDNTTIPYRIFLQGYTNNRWLTLGSVEAYVSTGGWLERSLTLYGEDQFSKFRLITHSGQFGIRHWFLYSSQQCFCEDHSQLSVNLSSINGLPTIQSVLEDLASYNTQLLGEGCVGINNCTIPISTTTSVDFANDGVCEDAIYIASQLGITPSPQLDLETYIYFNISVNGTVPFPFMEYTSAVFPGVDSIQFAVSPSDFINVTDQQMFYAGESGQQGLNPNYPPFNVTDFNISASPANSTIYYLNSSTLLVISTQQPRGQSYVQLQYLNGTFVMIQFQYSIYYGGVVERAMACCAGCDLDDCGSSIRNKPIQKNVLCSYSPNQQQLVTLIQNQTIIVNQTLFVTNLTSLAQNWTAYYKQIPLLRAQVISQLNNCPGQVCPISTPWRCPNGECVEYQSQCINLYDCPGNGCVEITGASSLGNEVWRCACGVGHGGSGCQYGPAKAATPRLGIGQAGVVPGGLEITCEGPPPPRLKPGVDENLFVNEPILNALNMQDRADSPKKSAEDLDYNLVKPISNWGTVLRYYFNFNLVPSTVQSQQAQSGWTTCIPMRVGFHGEINFLVNDVLRRDPVTGKVLEWRRYQDPSTPSPTQPSPVYQTYVWTSITNWDTYQQIGSDGPNVLISSQNRNNIPWRCGNGQCVKDQSYCAQSEALFPVCNNLGECRADGYCKCVDGYRSFLLNDEFSNQMKYPYSTNLGVPNPTADELNWNWFHHGLSWCTARDCSQSDCTVPKRCFPGTAEKNFEDALIACTSSTGNLGRCAPSASECIAGTNLAFPLVCAGNGIERTKDFTDEKYCSCGSPNSVQANLSSITQIVDLKPNGWGGIGCDIYDAPAATTVWSPWNFQADLPWVSIEGDSLLGVWLSGAYGLTADPDDMPLWHTCCPNVRRLDMCGNVLCNIQGQIKCVPSAQCILPNSPREYRCSNHGTLRADGTCLCDYNAADGSGYTSDFTQFSVDNCWRKTQCPFSRLTNTVCNVVPACSSPSEVRYPAPLEPYLQQQYYLCGNRQGLIDDATIMNQIATSVDFFFQKLIEAFTEVALAVQIARAAVQSCICVYPNDTLSMKTGMVAGSSYIYSQTFNSPSFLFGNVTNYPLLTDGTLEGKGYQSYLIPSGTVLTFHIDEPQLYNVSLGALRVFGNLSGTGTIQLTSSTNVAVCLDGKINQQVQTGLLDWIVFNGGPNGAFCGPTYTCAADHYFDSIDQFQLYCGVSQTTQTCIDWQYSMCISNPAIYFYRPTGSPLFYQGCPDTCTCCQLSVNSPFPPINDNVIQLTYIGTSPIRIGQIELWGYGSTALLPTTKMEYWLSQRLGTFFGSTSSQCQDFSFYSGRDYFGTDGNYFIPPENYTINSLQSPQQWPITQSICEERASWLAAPQSLQDPLPQLQFICNTNSPLTTKSKCWAGAKDSIYLDEFIGREDWFLPECEICYQPFVSSSFVTPISFSTYPNAPDQTPNSAANYRARAFTNQINTLFQIQLLNQNILSVPGDGINGAVVYSPLDPAVTISNCFTTFTYAVSPPAALGYTVASGPHRGFSYTFTGLDAFDRIQFEILFSQIAFPSVYQVTFSIFSTKTAITLTSHGTDRTTNNKLKDFLLGSTGDVLVLCALLDSALLVSDTGFTCEQLVAKSSPKLSTTQTNPHSCNIISLYDQDTCNNAAFYFTGSNTQTNCGVSNPRFTCYGSSPFYIIDGSCTSGGIFIMPPFSDPIQTLSFQNCPNPTLDISGTTALIRLVQKKAACFKIFKPYAIYKIQLTTAATRLASVGGVGDNWQPGLADFPYLPAFIDTKIKLSISATRWRGEFYDEPISINSIPVTNNIPIYFTQSLWPLQQSFDNILNAIQIAPIHTCLQCQNALRPDFLWLNYRFAGVSLQWNDNLPPGPLQQTYIYLQRTNVESLTPLLLPGTKTIYGEGTTLDINQFVHLTTYIESINNTLNSSSRMQTDKYNWSMSACLSVTAAGYQPRPCIEKNAYICQSDYLKYTVIDGRQCPPCGPNGRPEGTPSPGETCFTAYPLADPNLFPIENLIYESYLTGALDVLAQIISPPAALNLSVAVNYIYAIPDAWSKFLIGYSSRGVASGGVPSRGVQPDQSWCDLSMVWQSDCQLLGFSLTDPYTNERKRACALSSEFCDLSLPVQPGGKMNPQYLPPIFSPVDANLALTDPTCGYPVLLQSYNTMDKYGAPQSELTVNFTILQSNDLFIQVQIIATPGIWFNGGKTTNHYIFNWNYTSTITFQYLLQQCPFCPSSPTLDVIIFPLTVGYDPPSRVLSQTVTLVEGSLQYATVNFHPTPAETGVTTLPDGTTIPTYPYQGVGFNISLPVGTVIFLYNPIISDPTTRDDCQNRTLPQFYEPSSRIVFNIPDNECIYNDDTRSRHPGQDIGQCGCGTPLAGTRCDCLATWSKYGKEVCGGFGDDNSYVQGFDGNYYSTGEGEDSGCYILSQTSDCKTVDIGTFIFTLLTDAISNPPSVEIEVAPTNGNPLFLQLDNSTEVVFEEAVTECEENGDWLAYYDISNELNQLITFPPPVLISTDTPITETKWPWLSPVTGTFFVNGEEATEGATIIGDYDCASTPDFCLAINFNNWAYLSSTSILVDGNTITASAATSETILFNPSAPLVTSVYLFAATGSVTCSGGGDCGTTPLLCQYSGGGYYCVWGCRCPNRALQLSSLVNATEVQVFSDEVRVSLYSY